MFDWLRNLLMPTPALVGVTTGRATLPAVMAFSEEGGGEQPPAEEKPAEPPAAETPVETPAEAPAPAPAPPTGDVPATQSVSTPSEILGRPMMTFVTDMTAALGALLVFIAFFLPYIAGIQVGNLVVWPGRAGFGLVLGWQGLLIALLTLFLVVSTITFWKKKNWALVYADCGGFLVAFAILQVIISRGGPHVGWFFVLFGGILNLAAGILQWLVFKDDSLEKPWPVGMTVKIPGV